MSHQRQPGLLKWFYKIPKPIRIYFGVVLGVALVIGSVFVINEMQNRLNPPSQILLELEDDPPPQTDFLRIYVWKTVNSVPVHENYELKNGQEPPGPGRHISVIRKCEELFFSEMATGEPVRVSYEREALMEVAACSECYDDREHYYLKWGGYQHRGHGYSKVNARNPNGNAPNPIYAQYTEPLLIAKADAYIEVTGALCGTNKGSDEYIKYFGESPDYQAADDNRALYHILARPDHVKHETNGPSRDPDEELGTGEWNGEARDRFYYQSIDEVYPDVPSAYKQIRRRVNESAMLFSAYSKTSPDILLAQAEVKVTHYSCWGYEGMRPEPNLDESVFNCLNALGIYDDPDTYGYTEVEIVDYWENPEYLGE